MSIQMAKQHRTLHTKPAGTSADSPKDLAALEFARRLQKRMTDKGMNQSELARAATLHMVKGEVTRDSISKYINAAFLPSPAKLAAIAKVLDCEPEELVETRGITASAEKHSGTNVRDLGEGQAWLRINQPVPWLTAIKILELLKGDANE